MKLDFNSGLDLLYQFKDNKSFEVFVLPLIKNMQLKL